VPGRIGERIQRFGAGFGGMKSRRHVAGQIVGAMAMRSECSSHSPRRRASAAAQAAATRAAESETSIGQVAQRVH
jgi:hypothetical protein